MEQKKKIDAKLEVKMSHISTMMDSAVAHVSLPFLSSEWKLKLLLEILFYKLCGQLKRFSGCFFATGL